MTRKPVGTVRVQIGFLGVYDDLGTTYSLSGPLAKQQQHYNFEKNKSYNIDYAIFAVQNQNLI